MDYMPSALCDGLRLTPTDAACAAVCSGNVSEMLRLLSERDGVDTVISRWGTALHVAVYEEQRACADALVAGGANVSAIDQFLITPLHSAILVRSESMAKLLLDAGADPNFAPRGQGPLCAAVIARSAGIVRLLLSHGADPDARPCSGVMTPREIARDCPDPTIADLLRAPASGSSDETATEDPVPE